MIHSMTAFCRHEQKLTLGTVVWEIRSVNHRYLDLSLRLAENFRRFDNEVRDGLRKNLSRGKVDATLTFFPDESRVSDLHINPKAVKNLLAVVKKINQISGMTQELDLATVLRWPGVAANTDTDVDIIQQELIDSLLAAIKQLISMRAKEGVYLNDCILERIIHVADISKTIKERAPALEALIKEKMQARVAELAIKLDNDRFEQEVVMLLHKHDVAEELDRLTMHVKEVQSILAKGGVCGRRLDFLMQELHREVNTLGVKIVDSKSSSDVVDLKVLIEQMREQVQNIE